MKDRLWSHTVKIIHPPRDVFGHLYQPGVGQGVALLAEEAVKVAPGSKLCDDSLVARLLDHPKKLKIESDDVTSFLKVHGCLCFPSTDHLPG